MRYIVCRDIVEEIMADLAWFLALLTLFCSSPGILRQPQYLARERETFGYLSVHIRLMVLELASLEKKKKERKKERRKENDDFRFFQNSFSQLL